MRDTPVRGSSVGVAAIQFSKSIVRRYPPDSLLISLASGSSGGQKNFGSNHTRELQKTSLTIND